MPSKSRQKAVEIITGFAGAIPHSDAGVKREGPREFTIHPSWRPGPGINEEAPGMGERFWFKVANRTGKTARVKLTFDWEDEKLIHMSFRDILYIRRPRAGEWEMASGYTRDRFAYFELELPPGQTDVAHWPEYNCADLERFLARLKSPLVEKRVAGKSEQGRPIYHLIINDPSVPDDLKTRCLIMARNHAYETAGNFCLEGFLPFLLQDEVGQFLLKKFVYHLLPLTNPDGVDTGMGRLTAPRGCNPGLVGEVEDQNYPDATERVLVKALDEVNPQLMVNIHNWRCKFMDGLLGSDAEFAERVRSFMPDDTGNAKKWWTRISPDPAKMTAKEWKSQPAVTMGAYIRRRFKCTSLTFEFPWFSMNTEDMREKGIRSLCAVMFAYLEPGDTVRQDKKRSKSSGPH